MTVRLLFVMFGVVSGTLGCSFSISTPTTQTPSDQVATVVAATMASLTGAPATESISTPAATQPGGTPVSFEYASLVIPDGLASSANTHKMTAVTSNSGAPWDIAPTHLRFTLTGYPLESKFHEPRIFVYPAEEFARLNSHAAEQIDRIRKLMGGTALMKETLPSVPFFNASPLIAAHIKTIPFQNGNGVRALTQYAQYAAPINNHELFYHFQGLTSDSNYYVIAVLPITAPVLPDDEKPESPVPADGVPIPANTGPNDVYYFSVTEKLNSLTPDSYTPSLDDLDELVQSILVTNP